MALSRRTEVLFDEAEYGALKREADRRGTSVGELVREAVRRLYGNPSEQRRRQGFQWLIHGPDVDVGGWEEAKGLIGRWVDQEA
jgi:hypothetical protein